MTKRLTNGPRAERLFEAILSGRARVRGIVRVSRWERGRYLWTREQPNVVTNSGLPVIAALLAGAGTIAAETISVLGIGSGTSAVAATDTDITAPAYYKALGAPSFPAAGQVSFTLEINGSADAGAVGITIGEYALYANTGAIALPAARASGGGAPNLTMVAHNLWAGGTVAAGTTLQLSWTLVV